MGYKIKIENNCLKVKESDIVRQICKYLQIKKVFFWRQNNCGVYSEKKQTFLKSHYGIKGVPDIFLLYKNTLIGLEVKSEDGRLSKDQEYFKDRFDGQNRVYMVARSLQDVLVLFS